MSGDVVVVKEVSPHYGFETQKLSTPARYQQTELGVLPEDWGISRIDEFFNVSSSKRVFQSDWRATGIPFYRTREIAILAEEGSVENDLYIDESLYNLYASKYGTPKKGDLLVTGIGTIGKVYHIPNNERFYFKDASVLWLSSKASFDSCFLKYLFQSPLVREQISNSSTGTTVETFTISGAKQILIIVPPVCEQRAIATALSDVDALLEELDRLIAKKRDLKQATMQQLLTGQTRLPGFEGAWRDRHIGPEIDLLTGFPFPSADYFDSGIKLLRGSNIKRGMTDWSDDLVQYWPKVTHDITHYVLKEGDIVIAMDGSLVGRSFARLSHADLPALLLQRVARVRSQKIDMGYLKEWICSDFFTKHCDAHKTVTAIPHISPGDIRSFVIQIPPTLEEQAAIATFLSDMDAEIATLEQRRTKVRDIKQAMMQELLTGRTRLA